MLAQFYLVNAANIQTAAAAQSAVEKAACDLVARLWRQKKKVLVWCEDKAQAERMDDLLWALDTESFVPHNLAGEFLTAPTPVEIAWTGKRNQDRRDVVVNLHSATPEFMAVFRHIVDFVPPFEPLKAIARERYRHYRQQGWQLTMDTLSS